MQNHHAYVYEGPSSLLPHLAESACAYFGFTKEGNPDVYIEQWEKFGIEEARSLSQQASLKTASGRMLFVLGFSSITSEAQQALLKLFEEPRAGAMFVVLVPHGTLLPTLRSRFLEYPETLEHALEQGEAAGFLAASYAKRSAWIAAFLKDDEEDSRERVRVFLGELEKALYAELSSGKLPLQKEIRTGLEDIAHFRSYLSDRAPSLKMILEHCAVTLPKI